MTPTRSANLYRFLTVIVVLTFGLPLALVGSGARPAAAHGAEILIDFNNRTGLEQVAFPNPNDPDIFADCYTAVPGDASGAPATFANCYREDGLLAIDAVEPSDPALGTGRAGHYHLMYEDPTITNEHPAMPGVYGRTNPDGSFTPLADPAAEPRYVSSMGCGTVIQLTYDPNQDGIPDPFHLLGLDVLDGVVTVGVKSPAFGISKYPELTPGSWGLTDATDLIRATLETPVDCQGPFDVDNIYIQPVLNEVRNPDFEQDSNGDGRPDNWTSNSRFTRSTAKVFSGMAAGRHQATDNASYTISQTVNSLIAGASYHFAGAVNIPNTSDAFTFKLQIQWRDASNNTLRTDTVANFTKHTGGNWRPTSGTFTAPAGTTKAQIRMVVSSLKATIYVDTFALRHIH